MSRKKKKTIPRPMTKKERSRIARERRMNRLVIGGAIAVGLLVVAVLVYGYVTEIVLKAREPVATVNGVPIQTAEWQARVRAQAILEDVTQEGVITLAGQVLDQMVREELIRQEAARRGISVSEEEIDRAVELFFGYDREGASASEPSSVVTPTEEMTATEQVTEEVFRSRYQEYIDQVLKPSELGIEGFRRMIEASLLYEQVWTAITSEVPTVTEQVQIRYFAFPSEEEASSVADRLDQGEGWDAIAQELEGQEGTDVRVFEPRWRTLPYLSEQFDPATARIIFTMDIGNHTRPIPGAGGRYYVVQVIGHEERELDPTMRIYEQSRAFQEWLNEQMAGVEYAEDWMERIPRLP